MKKLLIATAALAMIAGTAQAQSSVTVYGIIDLGYGSKDYANNNYNTAADGAVTGVYQGSLSSQRLGFRGTEDLGGGLKANFTMESGMTSATAPTFAREYKVGVESAKMGRLDLGLSKTVSQLMMERYTAGGANNWIGDAWNYADATTFNATATTDTVQADQAPVGDFLSARATGLHYNSPNFNGLAVALTYANSDSKDKDGTLNANTKSNIQDLALVYSGIQNLSIGISQGRATNRAADASADTKATVNQLGASYVFGPATVFAQYIDSETKSTANAQSRALTGTQYGVKYNVSPKVTVHAQMMQMDEESTSGTKTHDREALQLGVQYAFSKRTTGYAIYGTQESQLLSSGVKNEIKGSVVGLRHSF